MKPRRIPSRGASAAANPIARAIAKAQAAKTLREAIRAFLVSVHLLKDGEDARAHVYVSIQVLTVCMMAMAKSGHQEHWSFTTMGDALKALERCEARNSEWLEADAGVVDNGLQCLTEIYPQLDDATVVLSWAEYRGDLRPLPQPARMAA